MYLPSQGSDLDDFDAKRRRKGGYSGDTPAEGSPTYSTGDDSQPLLDATNGLDNAAGPAAPADPLEPRFNEVRRRGRGWE